MNKLLKAVETYKRMENLEGTVPSYREFRALVIEEMKKDLEIPNAKYGTMGCYYGWARNIVTKRKVNFYHRLESTVNKTLEQRRQENEQEAAINAAFASWSS